jgi:hypothetical protein
MEAVNWILPLLLLLTLGVAFWFQSAGAREQARSTCKAICRRLGIQLLDDTVGLNRLRPGRNEQGRVCLVREYTFEYSPDGGARFPGLIRIRGGRMVLFMLEREGHREYLTPEQTSSL